MLYPEWKFLHKYSPRHHVEQRNLLLTWQRLWFVIVIGGGAVGRWFRRTLAACKKWKNIGVFPQTKTMARSGLIVPVDWCPLERLVPSIGKAIAMIQLKIDLTAEGHFLKESKRRLSKKRVWQSRWRAGHNKIPDPPENRYEWYGTYVQCTVTMVSKSGCSWSWSCLPFVQANCKINNNFFLVLTGLINYYAFGGRCSSC